MIFDNMVMDDLEQPTREAIERLSDLPVAERAGVLAILFEQWHHGLVNELDSVNPYEAEEQDKDVFYPHYIGLDNATDMAHAFYALYEHHRPKDNTVVMNPFPDLVEPAILQTPGMDKMLTDFWRLTYVNKMDFFSEVFARIGAKELFKAKEVPNCDFGVNGLLVATEILSYKRRNGFEYKPVKPEDLPFDFAE